MCDIKEIENRLIHNYVTNWKATIEKMPKYPRPKHPQAKMSEHWSIRHTKL